MWTSACAELYKQKKTRKRQGVQLIKNSINL